MRRTRSQQGRCVCSQHRHCISLLNGDSNGAQDVLDDLGVRPERQMLVPCLADDIQQLDGVGRQSPTRLHSKRQQHLFGLECLETYPLLW
jgi:hypothetical protein